MIPQIVKATLWSYDIEKIDLTGSKDLIITQVLNFGTKPAVDWLFEVYSKKDIEKQVVTPTPGVWNKKSLNFWSIFFNVTPQLKTRF
jgi:hypothetical protein